MVTGIKYKYIVPFFFLACLATLSSAQVDEKSFEDISLGSAGYWHGFWGNITYEPGENYFILNATTAGTITEWDIHPVIEDPAGSVFLLVSNSPDKITLSELKTGDMAVLRDFVDSSTLNTPFSPDNTFTFMNTFYLPAVGSMIAPTLCTFTNRRVDASFAEGYFNDQAGAIIFITQVYPQRHSLDTVELDRAGDYQILLPYTGDHTYYYTIIDFQTKIAQPWGDYTPEIITITKTVTKTVTPPISDVSKVRLSLRADRDIDISNVTTDIMSVTENIPSPEPLAYKYFKINASGISEGDLEYAYIEFKVKKDWMQEKASNDLVLMLKRYDEEQGWRMLKTQKVGEDGSYMYFAAETPVLALFEIGLVTYEEHAEFERKQAEEFIEETHISTGDETSEISETATEKVISGPAKVSESKSPGFEIILSIGALLFSSWKLKWRRRQ